MCSGRKTSCLLLLVLAIPAIMISGCGSTKSENVKSSGINAKIVLTADSHSTKVETTLSVGSSRGTSLEIDGSDSLKATARGVTQTLAKERDLFGDFSYTTTFDFSVPDTEVVVSFDRPKDTSCPNSRVLMPDPFTLTAPSSGQVFTSQSSIAVNWTPAGPASGTVDVDFSTSCTATNGSAVSRSRTITSADNGATSVPVSGVLPTETYNTAHACTCDVAVSRRANGTLDPNYGEGGSVTGSQVRAVSIVLQQ